MFRGCCALATRMLQGRDTRRGGAEQHWIRTAPPCSAIRLEMRVFRRWTTSNKGKAPLIRTRCLTPFRSDALKTRSTRGNVEAARCGHSREASSAGDDVDQRAKTCIERGFSKQAPLERRGGGHRAGMGGMLKRPIPGCRVASGYSSTSSPKHSGIWKLGVSLSVGLHER